jgi:hypothetical protein
MPRRLGSIHIDYERGEGNVLCWQPPKDGKAALMISSPCKTCVNRKVSKDLCLDACKKIREVQNLLTVMPGHEYSAVDSSDSNRYRISMSTRIPRCE